MKDFEQDIIEAARRTVCQHAKDAPEARDLMRMLGIHPHQDGEDTLSVGPGELPTYMNRHNQR